ncbi:MAG: hypothetical protein ABII23_06810 [bacterium]
MPQRNSHNPIKAVWDFGTRGKNLKDGANTKPQSTGGGHCPSCGAEVPPKPGFRFSSLTCPKCGASMRASRGQR